MKDGCNQRFWATSELWKGIRGQTPFYLANYCIQGVGLVGTAESAEFLKELRTADFLKVGSDEDLGSAVISAAAYADLLREHGSERFYDDIFMRRAEYEFFVSWKASEYAEL